MFAEDKQTPTTQSFFVDFYAISEQTMDFSMNYYLRLSWIDSKLAFKPEDNFGRDQLTLETRDITG